ncbi:MAG: AtpZ/AtpI family protein [Burkholderiaceae bacterium]
MTEHTDHAKALAEQVDAKARRKLRSRRRGQPGVWFGLGMMGIVGWSVVVPTLIGAALGRWLDTHYPGSHPWTLALLMAGLVIGCFNAWYWVRNEERAMAQQEEDDRDA